MKKLFTILAVMTAVVFSAKAEVLMKESFNRNVGDLSSGDYKGMGTDQSNWWWFTTGNEIQVVNNNLTREGYFTGDSTNAIRFAGSGSRTIRAFNSVGGDGKSVYYSALINVDSIKTTVSKEVLLMMTGSSTESAAKAYFAELRISYDKSGGGYKLGVSKANENGFRFTNKIPFDSTILVVVRYDFVKGDTNDVVSLWVNPTKLDEATPTQTCMQDTGLVGANQRKDAPDLYWMNLRPYGSLTSVIIDEIRVSDKWADLFEGGGGTDPAIGVNSSLSFGQLYQGTETSKDLIISAVNLKGGITLSNSNADISLSKYSLTKAEAEAGAKVTVSLKANAVWAQVDTIILSSEGVEKKVAVSWTSYPVVACANVAALKDSVKLYEAYAGLFRLNGEAIVTRDTTIDDREIYLQDASGAVKLFDSYGKCGDNLVGAKVKGFILNNGEEALGILPFYVAQAPTIVSTGNTVEPQEVSLADLQANAVDYLLELVKIKGVAFEDAGGSFAVGQYAISQSTEDAKVKVENNNIVGKVIPAKAHVIGFCFNTSGSVILPRNIDDIIDANPELLKNGSFEDYKTSSSPYGSATTFEDWEVSSILGTTLVAETSDVLEGKAAFKTTSDVSKGYIYQELNCQDYAEGDEFKVRIGYKNLNDSLLALDCFWSASMGGESMAQGAVKQVLVSSKSKYNVVEVKTAKPEGAKYFKFKINIPRKALVLIDDCAFTYQEISTKVDDAQCTMHNGARKIIRNGQMLIIRDGVTYNIAGQKL